MDRVVHVMCCQKAQPEPCSVFVSFRVNEASTQASALQDALLARGVRAYVCNSGFSKLVPGDDWETEITRAMGACTLFVVLATKTYGAEGTENIDTKKELSFALRTKKMDVTSMEELVATSIKASGSAGQLIMAKAPAGADEVCYGVPPAAATGADLDGVTFTVGQDTSGAAAAATNNNSKGTAAHHPPTVYGHHVQLPAAAPTLPSSNGSEQ